MLLLRNFHSLSFLAYNQTTQGAVLKFFFYILHYGKYAKHMYVCKAQKSRWCTTKTKPQLLLLLLKDDLQGKVYISGLVIAQEQPYYGSFMGTVSNKEQGISGDFYSVDESTVYLKNFTYSGTGTGTRLWNFNSQDTWHFW